MVQDSADRERVGDVGNDLEGATAASAHERIRLKDLGDEPRPAWGAAALLGLLLLVLLASQFLGWPLAAYAVGVLGREVEEQNPPTRHKLYTASGSLTKRLMSSLRATIRLSSAPAITR
jgi:hypothetical protein